MTQAEPVHGLPNAPVMAGQRIITLDFIRGVAVLGILFANIVVFGHPLLANSWPGGMAVPMDRADGWVWLGQFVLIDGKMRGLFTVLFGAGMMLFMQRARARGQTKMLQLRRLVWLLGFGAAHFFLLFWGDILFLYAISGMAALLLVDMDAKAQLRIGLTWYFAACLLMALLFMGAALVEQMPALAASQPGAAQELALSWAGQQAQAAQELAIFRQGDWLAEIRYGFENHGGLLLQYPFIALIETIPLMVIGMGLFGLGFFSGDIDPVAMRKWAWRGIGLGLALCLPLGWWAMQTGFAPNLYQFIFTGLAGFSRLPMILGLAALLALLAPQMADGWLGTRLIAAGQMAFSNYIGTSILMMAVFRHWGLGLFGELGRAQLMIPALLGCAVMLAWSKPWYAHFRYGPLEWLWRCLTYGQLFPMRRRAEAGGGGR